MLLFLLFYLPQHMHGQAEGNNFDFDLSSPFLLIINGFLGVLAVYGVIFLGQMIFLSLTSLVR